MKSTFFLGAATAALLVSASAHEVAPERLVRKELNAGGRHVAGMIHRRAPTQTTPPLSAITKGMPSGTPEPLFTTFAPGATPPIKGAPPLPTFQYAVADWPTSDKVANLSTPSRPELAAWKAKLQAANIPNIPVTKPAGDDGDPCAANPNARANGTASGTCWWTCGGCSRDTDVVTCPDKDTWGVSYDDGPTEFTPKILRYLNDKKLKSTFFVVGSRVIGQPAILQAEYMLGHQISVHTWSHNPLTQLTNEQIVAELAWTMIAIKAVIGVTPSTMRPPYGDMDDRVRAICKMMGLTPVIWTGTGDAEFDTKDWFIPGGRATGTESFAQFQKILGLAQGLSTGFIVLEHDLWRQEVEMGVGYFLPAAEQKQFTLKSINDCQAISLENSYKETRTSSGKHWTFDDGSSSSTNSSSTSSVSSKSSSSSTSARSSSSSPTTGVQPAGGQATGAGFARADLAGTFTSSMGVFGLLGMAGVLLGSLVIL